MRGPALLFCPANRPERYAKAAAVADSVILDLEDAVAAEAKADARTALVQNPLHPDTTIVRVNPVGGADFQADLAALAETNYKMIMVAKAESADQMADLDRYAVIALCETARGIENVAQIAAHRNVQAVMWGAEDLIASMGGRTSRQADGSYREVARYARSRALLSARAAGVAAIDSVYLDIGDLDGLRAEAADAAAVGFSATAGIHPTQVAAIRAGYAPSAAEADWARRVLAAASRQGGVFRFEGAMVDEPVLRQAREIQRRASD